jgi:hypothetical protein
MPDPLPPPLDSDAGQAAFFALRMCRVWADASPAAHRRFQELLGDQDYLAGQQQPFRHRPVWDRARTLGVEAR